MHLIKYNCKCTKIYNLLKVYQINKAKFHEQLLRIQVPTYMYVQNQNMIMPYEIFFPSNLLQDCKYVVLHANETIVNIKRITFSCIQYTEYASQYRYWASYLEYNTFKLCLNLSAGI